MKIYDTNDACNMGCLYLLLYYYGVCFFPLTIFNYKIFMTASYLFTSFLNVYFGIFTGSRTLLDVLPCLTFKMSYVKSVFFKSQVGRIAPSSSGKPELARAVLKRAR